MPEKQIFEKFQKKYLIYLENFETKKIENEIVMCKKIIKLYGNVTLKQNTSPSSTWKRRDDRFRQSDMLFMKIS